jgi:hypothetical protein
MDTGTEADIDFKAGSDIDSDTKLTPNSVYADTDDTDINGTNADTNINSDSHSKGIRPVSQACACKN